MKRFLLTAVVAGALATGATQSAQAWWGGPPEHVVRYDHHHGRPVFVDDCRRHEVVVLRPPVACGPQIYAVPVPVQTYDQPYYQPGFVSIAGRNFALQFGF